MSESFGELNCAPPQVIDRALDSSLPDLRGTGIQDKHPRVRDSRQRSRIPELLGRKLTRDQLS